MYFFIEGAFVALMVIGITFMLATISGIFTACRHYMTERILHKLNKSRGAKSHFIVTGDPALVQLVREVCIQTVQRVENQTKQKQGIPINEQSNTEENRKG